MQNIFCKKVVIFVSVTPKVMVLPEEDLVCTPQLGISHDTHLISWRVNCSHLSRDFSRSSSYSLS